MTWSSLVLTSTLAPNGLDGLLSTFKNCCLIARSTAVEAGVAVAGAAVTVGVDVVDEVDAEAETDAAAVAVAAAPTGLPPM